MIVSTLFLVKMIMSLSTRVSDSYAKTGAILASSITNIRNGQVREIGCDRSDDFEGNASCDWSTH